MRQKFLSHGSRFDQLIRASLRAVNGATGELSHGERFLLDTVVTAAGRYLGEDWGAWRVRDGRDDSGLTVDATFEDSNIAIELTALQDPEWMAAGGAAIKYERELTDFARRHGLSGWVVGVSSNSNLRNIRAAVKPLMKAGTGIRPMDYTADDLEDAVTRGEQQAFLERHRALRELGLSLLQPRVERDTVDIIVFGAGFQFVGFTDLLARAVTDNADKLSAARPRETHLAVLVSRWDLSDRPSETPPPQLPSDVDVLWVAHPGRATGTVTVWMARRGDLEWRLTNPPLPS